jgi:hypothetical protein
LVEAYVLFYFLFLFVLSLALFSLRIAH